jgi:ubiquinone/menaquinone biosynthesis C-methylase UbiE
MTATDLNRQYYEATNAGRDDYWRLMAAPRRRVQMILRLIGQFPEATSIVDVGCGNGVLLEEIRRRYPRLRLTGIDLSQSQIEINRARDKTIEWIAADAQQSSASSLDNRFDIVVTSEVVEHLDDPAAFVGNTARLASRERGRLILTTQSGTISETERRVGHVHHFPAQEMRDLLQANGWKPIRVWNEGYPFHNLSKWFAGRNADSMMQRFDSLPYGPAERFACWMLRVAFRLNSRSRGAQLYAVAVRA